MQGKSDDIWTEWIAAEAAADEQRADAALHAAMQGVPRYAPGPALSARLLQAAAVRRTARSARSERLIAAGLVALALVMTLLPVGVVGVLLVTDAGRVVSWLARGCVWLTDWLNAGVSVWGVLAGTGSALGHAVSSPAASAALTVTLLVASSALVALNRFLTEERS
jgi:hypothetical protein